jgi:hypothetical protein
LLLRNTLVLALALPILAGPLRAQGQQPYSVEQLVRLIQSRVFTEERILGLTQESCLGFRLDEASEAQLRSAGATDALMDGLRDNCIRLPYGVESLRVAPDSLELAIGRVQQLRAVALDADSIAVNNVPIDWISSDSSIASVFGDGVVVGKALGLAVITAQVEGSFSATMRVSVVEATAEEIAVANAKSPTTAAVLGIVPGGGEFYTGNTTKGIVILAGSAVALAAGFLITSEDTLPSQPLLQESCADTNCTLTLAAVSDVTTKSLAVAGIAVAGALWAYGLIDGIRTAKKSQVTTSEPTLPGSQGLSFQLLPADGVHVDRWGRVELTFVRVQ